MRFLVGVALEAAFSSLSVCLPDEYVTISFRVWLSKEFKNPFFSFIFILLYTISGAKEKKGMGS
jgi:hypothetical protein